MLSVGAGSVSFLSPPLSLFQSPTRLILKVLWWLESKAHNYACFQKYLTSTERSPEKMLVSTRTRKVSFQIKGQKRCLQDNWVSEHRLSLSGPMRNPWQEESGLWQHLKKIWIRCLTGWCGTGKITKVASGLVRRGCICSPLKRCDGREKGGETQRRTQTELLSPMA